ncbi:putative Gp54 protein [Trichinella spiralis]|uniref:putative Gp54 protein n=1 Tax=Trichinella spiralis TaxID=6334 RepID=UPI0001EFB6A5|nr:putative Gp54 protein [Trichinella spiralis]
MHFSAPLSIVLLTLLIEVHYADALFGRHKPWVSRHASNCNIFIFIIRIRRSRHMHVHALISSITELLQCIFQNLHIFLFTIFIVCNWLANFSEKTKRVTKRNEEKWEACFDFLYSVKCGQEECKEFKDRVDSFSKNQRNSPEFTDAFKNFDECAEKCFDRILKEKNLEEYHEQLNRLQIEGSSRLVKKGVNPKDKYGMLHECLSICNKNSQLFMAALKSGYPLCSYLLLQIISCGELVFATFAFYYTY